jgi:hypothetical protein
MPAGDGYGGRAAQRWVRLVLAEYGTTCHLCHHGGADSGDHLLTRAARPDLMYVVSNGRPVHHKACPVCGVRCNIRRKSAPLPVAPEHDGMSFFEARPTAR